jgi:hypothetical protein
MKSKDSKYGVRPEEVLGTVQEIWKRKDILDLCAMMGWDGLRAAIKALPITPKEVFTDKIKHGDVQITLYRNAKVTSFDDIDCPFHFTVEGCK